MLTRATQRVSMCPRRTSEWVLCQIGTERLYVVGGAAGFRRKSSRGFVLALSSRFLVVPKLKFKLETETHKLKL